MSSSKLQPPSPTESGDVLSVVQDSRNWMTLGEVASISDVSRAKCHILLKQFVSSRKISAKEMPSGISYASNLVAMREKKAPPMFTEFRMAKALFQVYPQLLRGKSLPPLVTKPSQAQSLAMLART